MADTFTPNLQIEHLRPESGQPDVVVNQALDDLDGAITAKKTLTVDSSNALSISASDFERYFFFEISAGSPAPTGRVTCTVPAVKRGLFCIIDDLGFGIAVQVAGQVPASPVVAPGTAAALSCDAAAVRGRVAPTEGFSGFSLGSGAPGDVIFKVVMSGGVTFPAGFVGSRGKCGTAPSLQADCEVYREVAGVPTLMGLMRFPAGSNDATFQLAAAVTLNPGDVLAIYRPNPADAVLSDIFATLVAGRG